MQPCGMRLLKTSSRSDVRPDSVQVLGETLPHCGCPPVSLVWQLTGIGPSGAARLLVDAGDIHRFADRDKFASWNGTAPLDASSGDQKRHRLSRAGNRRINRALHIMAVVQLRNPTQGRAYFDAKKAAGKTSMESMRALKRRLSNVVYAHMLADHRHGNRLRSGSLPAHHPLPTT